MNQLRSSSWRPGARSAPGALVALSMLASLAAACRVPPPAARGAEGAPADPDLAFPSTFSIAALDPGNGDLGVAVQSRFFGVGAVVPWVEAGVGAIATQSHANTAYGPQGLERLRRGESAAEAVKALTEADARRDWRQLGIVDARGAAANHTGESCLAWAGARSGPNFTAQGNILVGPETVEAMAAAFESSAGEELAERLMRALEAGQRAGGDVRGQQSAALYVARKGAGYGGNDRYVWLHVEDHPRPIAELRRLLELRFGRDAAARARAAARSGKEGEARRILEQAASAPAADPWPAIELAQLEADALVKLPSDAPERPEVKKRLDAAIAGAVARDPSFDNVHYQAARIYASAGETAQAIASLRRLLEINPRYREAVRREIETPRGSFAGESIKKAIEAEGWLKPK
jgi:uncharacterized Ntn-hydrolase superfamily protein